LSHGLAPIALPAKRDIMNGKSSVKTSAATTKEVDTGSRSSTGKNKPLKGPNNFIEDIFLWGYTPPGNLKAFEKIKRGDKIVLLPAFARIDPRRGPLLWYIYKKLEAATFFCEGR